MDERSAARFTAALTRLYASLESPLQLLVRSRPWRATSTPDHAGDISLDAVMARHNRTHVEIAAPLRRTVYCVVTGTSRPLLEMQVENARDVLASGGLATERLCDERLWALYADLQTPWRVYPREVYAGDERWRGIALRRLPGGEAGPDWLTPLLTTGVCGDVAIHVRPVAPDDALRSLRRRLRDHTSQQMVDAEAGRVDDIRSGVAVDNIDYLRERLAANRARPVEIAVVAMVRAADARSLTRAANRMEAAWAMTGATAAPTYLRHDAAAIAVLPLASCPLENWKLCDSDSAAAFQPWAQVGIDDAGGYRIGHDSRDALPITLDPFASDETTNANVALMAASGHGKSFTLALMMTEAVRRGRQVIVLDPEGEYRGLTQAVGGRYVDLAPGTVDGVNVFETGINEGETVASVVELVSILCGRIDETERALVDAAATACTRTVTRPVLGDLLRRMGVASPRISAVLGRHCNGGLLARHHTLDAGETPVLGIGLRDLPAELVPGTTYVVAQWLWTLIRTDRRRRHIVVDEAGLLLEHPALRGLLVHLARRCRKYDASLIVATQNAADLLSAQDAAVVATNAATVLLGGQRAADVAVMERAFGLTDAQGRFLEGARRGEFLLISGSRRVRATIDAPPEYRELMRGQAPVSA